MNSGYSGLLHKTKKILPIASRCAFSTASPSLIQLLSGFSSTTLGRLCQTHNVRSIVCLSLETLEITVYRIQKVCNCKSKKCVFFFLPSELYYELVSYKSKRYKKCHFPRSSQSRKSQAKYGTRGIV